MVKRESTTTCKSSFFLRPISQNLFHLPEALLQILIQRCYRENIFTKQYYNILERRLNRLKQAKKIIAFSNRHL